jgi:hypothetical protein
VLACGCIYARPAAAAAAAAAQVNWPANIIARLKSLIPEPPIQPPPRTSSPPGASPPRPDRRLASSLPLGCVAAWPHRLPPPPRRLASSPPRRLANCMER